ncbi:MAG: sugar-binding transcriptional regulator [Spirochaetales bacterium]|nr:sugar-binding transcriptional regulator [Spirochaetales bacterium]
MDAQDKKYAQLAYIARLYYDEGRNQQEIADITGINRTSISRILTEARDCGIVTIDVAWPWRVSVLEQELRKKFPGLKEVCVVACDNKEYEESVHKLGLFAGKYLLNIIHPQTVIGVGWGKALYETIENLPREAHPEAEVVQVIGATGYTGILKDGPLVAKLLSDKLSCNCRYLHVPLIVESRVIRDSLLKDKAISGTLEIAANADIIITGIGSVLLNNLYTLYEVGYVSDEEVLALKEAGACGDILGLHYDANGELLDLDINHRTLSISLEKLSQVDRSIAVAGHEGKAEAIIGALRGGFINTLITDNFAAERMLSLLA